MLFFTIPALVIFGLYGAKRNQFYKASGNRFLFSRHQATPAVSAADTQYRSFNNDLI